MARIQFEVPHTLSLPEAKRRMEKLTQYWAKHGIQTSWSGEEAQLTGKVMGMHLDATMRVSAKSVGGEATDPGMLLRSQAKKYLTHKFETWLDPTNSVEELERS
jgi:Putative polyhydroxyalkanoic acid system protein (PHA_gran_rgn)